MRHDTRAAVGLRSGLTGDLSSQDDDSGRSELNPCAGEENSAQHE